MGQTATTEAGLTRVCERVAAPFAGTRVDRDVGVIRGALICGTSSQNGRDYFRESFGDGKQYAGRHVYLNHDQSRRERRAEDKVGWFGDDIRFRANGMPEGDFHVLKSHPMADAIFEAAERNPSLFGFSHIALLKETSGSNGRKRVESIREVASIDLVSTPATTSGFYESVQGGSGVKTTLREVIEGLRANLPADRQAAARKLLLIAEDDAGVGGMLSAPVDAPADDVDPDQAIDDAFKQAMHAQVDALLADSHTLAEFITKCRELYKSRAKILDKPTPEGGEGGESKPESVQKPAVVDDATLVAECTAAKFEPSFAQGVHLRNIPDAVTRKVVIESWRDGAKAVESARAGEKPRSAGRHGSDKVNESAADKTVQESKAFAWQD